MRPVRSLAAATSVIVAALAAGPAAASPPPSSSPEPGADALAPQPLDEPTTIEVGISSRLESFLVMLLGDSMGEFEKENLTLDIQVVPTSDGPLLLSQGKLDVVPTSTSAGLLNAIAEGLGLRGVFPLNQEPPDSGQGFWVRKDVIGDDGFQPADLDGQRVLTPNGSGSFTVGYFWNTILAPAGIEPNDIVWERFPVADTPIALISGAAPAAMVLTPFWSAVADDGCCVLIEGGYPQYATSFYAFGPSLLDEDEAAGQAFVRALARTTVTYLQGDYHNDPDLVATVAEVLEQPADVVQGLPSLVWDPEFDFRDDELELIQEFFLQTGDLTYDSPMPLEDIYDDRFVTALGGD